MDALTPEGWLFVRESRVMARGHAGVTAHEHHPVPFRSPCFMDRVFCPFRLQPPYVVPVRRSGFRTTGLTAATLLTEVRTDRQRRLLGFATGKQARHDVWPNRVRCLRTGHSPPVALHLTSRPRSYIWLPGSDLTWTRTFTSLVRSTHKRTFRRARPGGTHNLQATSQCARTSCFRRRVLSGSRRCARLCG